MEGESSRSNKRSAEEPEKSGKREVGGQKSRRTWGAIGAEVYDFSDLPPDLDEAVRSKILVMNDEAECDVRVTENGDIVVGKSKMKNGTGNPALPNAVVAVVATKDPDTNHVVMNVVCKLADEEVILTNPKNQGKQK